jgi:hypothetical protein
MIDEHEAAQRRANQQRTRRLGRLSDDWKLKIEDELVILCRGVACDLDPNLRRRQQLEACTGWLKIAGSARIQGRAGEIDGR